MDNVTVNQDIPVLVWHIRNAFIPAWFLMIVFGLVGNILTVILLNTPNLCHNSTSVYLRWLAVVDILYLLCSLTVNLIEYVTVFPLSIRQKTMIFCLGLPFLHYSLSHLSVWLLVSVTVDRMIWVVLPFNAKKICSHRNAVLVASSLVVVFMFIDTHFFYTVSYRPEIQNGSSVMKTSVCEAGHFTKKIFPYIDLVLLLVIPFVLMIVCNSAIIFKLRKMKKIRETRLQCPINDTSSSNTCSKKKQSSVGSSSLTAMLLSINVLFVVSITPLLVYDIIYFAADLKTMFDMNEEKVGALLFGIEQIVYTLWYLNFSAHFLLYCMSGPRFRKEAMKLFGCNSQPGIETNMVTEHVTCRTNSRNRL